MKKITSVLFGAVFAASLSVSAFPKLAPVAPIGPIEPVAPAAPTFQNISSSGTATGSVKAAVSAQNPNFNVSFTSDSEKSDIGITVKDGAAEMTKEEYFKELRKTVNELFGANTDITKSLLATLTALESVFDNSGSIKPQLNLTVLKTNPYSCTASLNAGLINYSANTLTTASPDGTTQTSGKVTRTDAAAGRTISVGPYGTSLTTSNQKEYEVDIKGDANGGFSGKVGNTVITDTSGSSGGNTSPTPDSDDDNKNDKVPDNTVVTSKSN